MPSIDKNDRDAVLAALEAALAADPGQNASELARPLGLHKSDVNPLLYNSGRFVKSADTKPRWYLSGDAPTVVDEPEVTAAPASSTTATPLPRPLVIPGEGDEESEELSPEELARFIKAPSAPRTDFVAPQSTPENPFALYDWQREALDKWEIWKHQGIIDAVTGAGKTRLAVAAIAQHRATGGRSLVLVPTIVLLHQWAEVLRDAIPDLRIGKVGDGRDDDLRDFDVVIAVNASARSRVFRLAGAEGLIVVDECHRIASEKNQFALDDRFAKRLGLSATHERMDNAHETVLLPFFKRVVFTLDYARAIRDGVITNVRVAFVGVNFSEEEAQQYHKIREELLGARRKLIREFGVRPAPFSVFLDDVLRLTSGGPGSRAGGMVANRWLTLWRQKRELLAETPAKQVAIAQMVGAMRDAERTLLFTQSITSANAITDLLVAYGINCESHHSDIDSTTRADIMARYAEGQLQALASVQTLEEGVDVPDADLAIIVASSKQRRQMIQRMGRVMRRKADGRDARFIILYVNKTDEDPRYGAHDVFVDELLDVARESNLFDLRTGEEEMRTFLDPRRLD